jgi:hypothetical protein
MNRGSCDAVSDLLPEFALGTLTGGDAADVVEHTTTCVTCRSRLTELSGVSDALLLLAPEREPTPSFTTRVTGAIDARPGRRHGSRWRQIWIATASAAAVVALVASGIVIGRATTADRSETAPEAGEIHEQSMVGAGGRAAGHVFLYRADPAWAVVSVDYGTLPPGAYSVATASAQGAATVGRVTVDADGRGAWGGTLADAHVDAVRIVDDAGHVLCEARFADAQSHDGSRS